MWASCSKTALCCGSFLESHKASLSYFFQPFFVCVCVHVWQIEASLIASLGDNMLRIILVSIYFDV